MNQPIHISLGLAKAKSNTDDLKREIQAAFAAGKIAIFTHPKSGIVKKVREWNPDNDGDLTAFESTGRTTFVCWEAVDYDITYVDA